MSEIKQFQLALEQNQARLQALSESFKNQMVTLINEINSTLQTLTRIDREFELTKSRIDDKQNLINHSHEQLTQLRESGSAIEAKIAGLYTELSEHQQQIAVLKAKLMEKTGRIETVEGELLKQQTTLEAQQNLLDEKQKELGRLQANKDQELAKQKEALGAAKKKIKLVQKDNPVADFLLSEAHEPTELDILALLIHKKEVPISEIKKVAKSPPAITSRVLKEMENKGILEIKGSDTVRLVISI
jgi:chromosome segregation ATPase